MELQAGARFPFTFDPAFQAYMDMVYGRLERRLWLGGIDRVRKNHLAAEKEGRT